MRRKYSIAIAVVLFLVVGTLFFTTENPPPPDFLDPAKTSAYTNLIALANQISGNPDSTNRAAFLAANQTTLAAIDRAFRDPTEAPDTVYSLDVPFQDHAAIKTLAKALLAQGQDAESHVQYREAVDAYANALHLGVRYEHGPLIYFLVGSAIERMSLRPIQNLIPKLPSSDLAALASKIQSINRDRIPFDEVVRREQYFAASHTRNVVELVRARFSKSIRAAINKSRKTHLELQTQLEGIAGASAALAYRRENQTSLIDIKSLTPKYLKSTPLDPYTDAPLRLITVTNAALLYSVGPNKQDDQSRADDIPFFFDDGVKPSSNNARP